MTFNAGDPGHVEEHNRLALATPPTAGAASDGAETKPYDVLSISRPGDPPSWSPLLRELLLTLGDTTHLGSAGGIEAVLQDILTRVAALETATPSVPGPTFPTAEGSLYVDNYSNGFIRLRDTDGLLADGQQHVVDIKVATTAGPGGVVIPTPNDIPASANPVWFDNGGALGYVDNASGVHVTQTGLRNWAKYGNAATTPYFLLWVRLTTQADDPQKPLLVVERSVQVG